MAHSHLLIAVPLALALSAGAYAGDDSKTSADQAESVEVLKAALPSTHGFEVVDVRAGADGAACITYNFIDKYRQFLGGGISPGMEIRLKSLRDYTAKLPLVKADWNFPLVGYDTRTNITSGVILGMAKEIDGIIDAYSERYTNFNVLLTGGDSPYFAQLMKNKIFADPQLIYKGLYAISEYN